MLRTLPATTLVLASLFAAAANAQTAEEIRQGIDLPAVVNLYEQLHAAPELSFQEKETAARIAKELEAIGCEVTRNVGGHGVVGLLKNGEGPLVMLRADLDALPVVEETGLPYASKVLAENERGATVGVMHACGHDIHMANLVGTARWLAAHREAWRGSLMFVGQPAEERGAGAQAMLEDGLFDKFGRPRYALAMHVTPSLPTGKIAFKSGYAMANVDSVDITIKGRGGHGAYPHTTIDPIVVAAKLVIDLQTIVAREVKPLEPAVVTVGSIRGGTKHNIIPDSCHLQLTVRSYTPEVRQQVQDAILRKAKAAAASVGAPEPVVKVSEGTPSLNNDPGLVARVVPALRKTLGDGNVVETEPVMGGEDFSRYGLAGTPIFMMWLGGTNQDRLAATTDRGEVMPSLHSAKFYPNAQEALATGVPGMVAAVLELMPPPSQSEPPE